MVRELKKWKCFFCEGEIVEGQLFTFISRGAVHWECFMSLVEDKLGVDNRHLILLELDKYLHEGIVKMKELEYRARDEETRQLLREMRKLLEGQSARVTKMVAERLGL